MVEVSLTTWHTLGAVRRFTTRRSPFASHVGRPASSDDSPSGDQHRTGTRFATPSTALSGYRVHRKTTERPGGCSLEGRRWRTVMRTLLNVIWLVLCGIWLAIGYAVAGIICCLLIVTIPFGLASFRMADFALWPF